MLLRCSWFVLKSSGVLWKAGNCERFFFFFPPHLNKSKRMSISEGMTDWTDGVLTIRGTSGGESQQMLSHKNILIDSSQTGLIPDSTVALRACTL